MNSNENKILREQFGIKRFTKDKLLEVYYVIAKPRYTYSVLRNQSHLDFLDQLKVVPTLLIRNTHDEFCSPQIKQAVKSHKNIRYIEIPGYHSDYYTNPDPYIDLLLKQL